MSQNKMHVFGRCVKGAWNLKPTRLSGLDISNLDFWIIVAKRITRLICWIGMLPSFDTPDVHTYAHTFVRGNAIHTRMRTYMHTPTFENNGAYP